MGKWANRIRIPFAAVPIYLFADLSDSQPALLSLVPWLMIWGWLFTPKRTVK